MKKRILPLLLVLALTICATAVFVFGCGSEDVLDEDTAMTSVQLSSLNQSSFANINNFGAKTADGKDFTHMDLQDADVTAINIWATTCPPCIREMPELAKLEEKLPDNLRLITYCVDAENAPEYMNYILKESGFHGVTLVDSSGDLRSLRYSLEYTPTTIFLDRHGNILGKEMVGTVQNDVQGYYLQHFNEALSLLGKDEVTI